MIRLLLDQGLALHAAVLLRADGLDVLHVKELGMQQAEDVDILAFAKRENRTCVTFDLDFHAHLAASRALAPSVILVRAQNMGAQEQAAVLKRVLSECEDLLPGGLAISVDRKSTRIRRLPLRRA